MGFPADCHLTLSIRYPKFSIKSLPNNLRSKTVFYTSYVTIHSILKRDNQTLLNQKISIGLDGVDSCEFSAFEDKFSVEN